MPLPSAKLTLCVVCVDQTIATADLFHLGQQKGLWNDEGEGWAFCKRVSIDQPLKPTLYANRQGGFRVCCPQCKGPLVGAFQQHVKALREGTAAKPICCSCGFVGGVNDVEGRPPVAFGSGALILFDCESAQIPALFASLPGVRVVWRRG